MTNLSSIAAAKAKLAEELRKLEEQEAELRQQQASDAFAEVMKLLHDYAPHFGAKQKSEIAAVIGAWRHIVGTRTRYDDTSTVTASNASVM